MKQEFDCTPGPLFPPVELGETLLNIEHVWQAFPLEGGASLTVLQEFSLSIHDIYHKPQVVSLLGPSGIGKTTALRLIAGLDRPLKGRVRIGRSGQLHDVCVGDVGVVFQRYPLFDDLSVLANLTVPALRNGLAATAAKEKALHFLEEFGLLDHQNSWPGQLSGGQRQRVAILQQLMLSRHFVILDEPFSGLDPVQARNVLSLIERVANEHSLNTFIIATHDITAALKVSNHIYLLGRERDEAGEPVSGARIVKEYDLIEEGIAYRPDAEDLPRFDQIRKEIRLAEFPRL
jgi:ABC-type nitrate/sulfonate/bicarbonate transport system ATPase subunit